MKNLDSTGANLKLIKIECDAGNLCNIPRLGLGKGYGSYAINGGPPIRIQYEECMTNNVAEISIIITALENILEEFGPSNILVRSDSQIALSWIKKANKFKNFIKFPEENVPYAKAAKKLVATIKKHKKVDEEWRGRAESVRLFGH